VPADNPKRPFELKLYFQSPFALFLISILKGQLPLNPQKYKANSQLSDKYDSLYQAQLVENTFKKFL